MPQLCVCCSFKSTFKIVQETEINKMISESYFIFGCIFLFLHVFIGWFLSMFCCGCTLGEELAEELNCEISLNLLFMVIMAPFFAIINTGRRLFLHIIEDDYKGYFMDMETITGMKH